MFRSMFEDVTTALPLSINSTLICFGAALGLGVFISIIYLLVTPRRNRSSNLTLSLVILPSIMAIVILLIGNNLARAFSMAGVFTLIRFRSVPGDSKDITFVFITMAAGLSIGMGYITLAAAITLLLGVIVVLIHVAGYGKNRTPEKKLRILVPEDMNYQGAFDDLFDKYTKKNNLIKVKTTNLGTLFELTYQIVLKNNDIEKEFLDALRSRNGNLSIQINIEENLDAQL